MLVTSADPARKQEGSGNISTPVPASGQGVTGLAGMRRVHEGEEGGGRDGLAAAPLGTTWTGWVLSTYVVGVTKH